MGSAIDTERRLDAGRAVGVAQHEETITETILLRMALALPNLKIETFSRAEESQRTGADWVWWWEGHKYWFGGLVQAKRLLDAPSRPHYHLGYLPAFNGIGPSPRQVDRLLAESRRVALPAMYALYNESVGQHRVRACPLHHAGSSVEGVSILDARVARTLLADAAIRRPKVTNAANVSLFDLAPFARPWSCLVTCDEFGCSDALQPVPVLWRALGFDEHPADDDLAYAAARGAALTAQATRSRDTEGSVFEDVAYVAQGLRREPPLYVYEAEQAFLRDVDRGQQQDELPIGVSRIVRIRRST